MKRLIKRSSCTMTELQPGSYGWGLVVWSLWYSSHISCFFLIFSYIFISLVILFPYLFPLSCLVPILFLSYDSISTTSSISFTLISWAIGAVCCVCWVIYFCVLYLWLDSFLLTDRADRTDLEELRVFIDPDPTDRSSKALEGDWTSSPLLCCLIKLSSPPASAIASSSSSFPPLGVRGLARQNVFERSWSWSLLIALVRLLSDVFDAREPRDVTDGNFIPKVDDCNGWLVKLGGLLRWPVTDDWWPLW